MGRRRGGGGKLPGAAGHWLSSSRTLHKLKLAGGLETLRDTASKHIRWSACLELSSPKLDGARKAGGIWKFLWSACLGGLNQSIKKALVFIVFLASGSSTGARGERPVIKNSWFLLYFRDFEFRGIEKHGKTGTGGPKRWPVGSTKNIKKPLVFIVFLALGCSRGGPEAPAGNRKQSKQLWFLLYFRDFGF